MALALSKKLAFSQRTSLRLIVTSATLRLSAAKDYLQDCESIELKARTYPVEIEHRMPSRNEPIWKQIALQLKQIIRERQGNVLIFMDGAFEISKSLLENHYIRKNIGYLYALENDASMILDTDDDNFPYPEKWLELRENKTDTLYLKINGT